MLKVIALVTVTREDVVISERWLPLIDLTRCTGCGDCVSRCPEQALGLVAGQAAVLHPERCTYAAECEAICPENAVALPYMIRRVSAVIAPAIPISSRGHAMLPYVHIASLSDALPEIPADSIISRTLHADDDVKAVLFGFAAGQELSQHTASQPATLVFVQGEADLTLGDDTMHAGPGTWVHMPPHLPHSVHAQTPLVMLLLLIRGGTSPQE